MIDESQFPSNSRHPKAGKTDKAPEEDRKLEKVVSGTVVRQKKPLGRRFVETFVGGDDSAGVLNYILQEILVPAAKEMLSDAVSQGMDRTLWGDSRPRSSSHRGGSRGGGTVVNYNGISTGRAGDRREDHRPSSRSRSSVNFEQVVVQTRSQAHDVLEELFEGLSRYEAVTVADLLDLCGLETQHTDQKFGWTDLSGSRPVKVKGGYMIDMPRPIEL